MTTIPFKLLTPTAQKPTRGTPGSTCYDLYADLPEPIIIQAGQRALIPTNVALQLPEGWEAQVRPRSGMAYKNGVVAFLGSIDSDYVGPIGVILFNHSGDGFYVSHGQRIAQLAFAQVATTELVATGVLIPTTRGVGGFGHTGMGALPVEVPKPQFPGRVGGPEICLGLSILAGIGLSAYALFT